MKRNKIKRVFLISEDHKEIAVIPQDFLGTLSDEAILDGLYTVGCDVWIGNTMYHISHQGGMIRHLRYEVVPVVQYEKTWFDYLLDAVRRA